MGRGCYNLVAAMLIIVNLEETRCSPDRCGGCVAGTFCGKDVNQPCSLCPPNSFSNTSGQKACDLCRRCEGVFKTKKACSRTRNTECECISGYHCVGAGCNQCQQDCEEGQELTPEGCKDCAFGTFYDQKYGACQPWTNCSLAGKQLLVAGTKEKDAVCGPNLVDFSPGTQSPTIVIASVGAPAPVPPGQPTQVLGVLLILTSTTVVILVLILVFRLSVLKRGRKKLLFLLKQPFLSPVHTSQEEDTCSCRFPEEEEGECTRCEVA